MSHTSRRLFVTSGAMAALVASATAASAHHVMDGKLPATFSQGFMSGVGHPIIGLDHLAFVIAVGIAAAFIARGVLMPLIFVAATVLGVVVHLGAFDLPFVEPVIALSVLLAGALIARGREIPMPAWAALFGTAGLFHGYAYGESIVGAETTALGGYFLGFAAIQAAIALAAMSLTKRLARGDIWSAVEPRVAGGVVAGVGLVFLAEAILPL